MQIFLKFYFDIQRVLFLYLEKQRVSKCYVAGNNLFCPIGNKEDRGLLAIWEFSSSEYIVTFNKKHHNHDEFSI